MADAFDPFLQFCDDQPDFDRADELAEAVRVADRNDHLLDVMDGTADLDDFLEHLYQDGIDPIEWMYATAEQLGYIIDNGKAYMTNEYGILLPA